MQKTGRRTTEEGEQGGLSAEKKEITRFSPGHHNEEVHDVPDVAQVGAAVKDEAEGEDLEARLDAEDPEEVDLGGLELLCEYRPVLMRQMLLEGEDHAIGDDGEQDGILKGRPLDDEARVLPYAVILRQNEQRRGATSPTATSPSALIPAWRHVHQTRYLKIQRDISCSEGISSSSRTSLVPNGCIEKNSNMFK